MKDFFLPPSPGQWVKLNRNSQYLKAMDIFIDYDAHYLVSHIDYSEAEDGEMRLTLVDSSLEHFVVSRLKDVTSVSSNIEGDLSSNDLLKLNSEGVSKSAEITGYILEKGHYVKFISFCLEDHGLFSAKASHEGSDLILALTQTSIELERRVLM